MNGKVVNIGITKVKRGNIENIDAVEAIKGKGLVNDRCYKEDNDKKCQITLIEIENINYYNKIKNTNISPIKFRRNIITENILKGNSKIDKILLDSEITEEEGMISNIQIILLKS